MYDNIVKHKFETKIDFIEQIYGHINKKLVSTSKTKINIEKLQKGTMIVKYSNKSKPHTYILNLSKNLGRITWTLNSAQRKETDSFINVEEILDLTLGSNATETMRKNKVPIDFDSHCFSMILKNKSLNIKAENLDEKECWVAFIIDLLIKKKKQNFETINAVNKLVSDSKI